MKTFILEWRPAISSYKMEDFVNDLNYLEYGEFNWSVWDWEKARSGDNFYMVKCGEGCTGIVMKGFFVSEPYEADDWSGRNRQVHYMDLRPTYMIHPDMSPVITTEELEKVMPDFQWNGGHSGRMLSEEQSAVLDGMWDRYVSQFGEDFWDCQHADRNLIPLAGIDDAVSIAASAFADKKDADGNPLLLRALAVGLAGKDDMEKICGFLDGVLAQPDYDAGYLRDVGFSEEIVDWLISRLK